MKKILVANRGEIAMRVMRTCKEMGIKTVAVFSEADRLSPHVRYADEAVCIGPAPSNQSYLLGNKIIEVAKKLGVDGIHPGYGFLSENADFSQAVSEAGLTFIGPRPHAIRIMGSKLAAKEAARSYNIPLVPGTESAVNDIEEAKNIAREIGYPILIKASAGGGGKGMRIVESDEDLDEQMERAISEALNAFGDGSVFIEKYVSSPRHIEIQVLADAHGNVIHLFERECSVQRRHQKVIEEAPSVILTPEIRAAMGKSACDVARSCDYLGAGTCEFIFDENNNFYFLEMNTRLQVEHPVTELITGVDLVRQQILIAMGQPLSLKQEDLKINGHALQLRVYAEDPSNNFLPSIGNLFSYRTPKGVGIRVDDGYEEGMDIPIYYDPMIAKLITYGQDRNEAIARMLRAIEEYEIDGPATTLSFGRFAFSHEAFISGNFDTHFVKKHFSPEKLEQGNEADAKIAAMLISHILENRHKKPSVVVKSSTGNIIRSKWKDRAK
jgi:acetyl-CoA carboxylase biotin carboxylase subunit